VQARSALFDLYGDHLVSRGGHAPVAALIRCLGALEISAPAVRTAVSRMVRQDWLTTVHGPAGPGYALTPRAVRRLSEASQRIYRRDEPPADHRWHLVTIERIRDRSRRDRVRAGLRYLGYGPLDDTTWVAARRSAELDALLHHEAVACEQFTAEHIGDSAGMIARVWDLAALAARYTTWLSDAGAIIAPVGSGTSDEAAFVARSRLVHEWRKFLFIDPRLPSDLLPADWAGARAARYFDTEATRLAPAAARFVDDCLASNGRRPG
jgi:phenylacetic acid degradation operon negative regulatory protein